MAASFLQCRNGVAAALGFKTAKEMLLALPRGAYTTGRTIESGARVFQLDFHIERLLSSARLMQHEDGVAPGGWPRDEAAFRSAVGSALGAAVRLYEERAGAPHDVRFTCLVTWPRGDSAAPEAAHFAEHGDFCTHWHLEALPPPPPPPIRCEVAGAPRANAAAKDSRWVAERRGMEEARGAGVEEVLLADAAGRVLEGTQTNFFAIQGGTVHTAGEGVLMGTVRDVVLRACADMGVPVSLEPPELRTMCEWEGCFITSTSRLVLPIDSVAHRGAEVHFDTGADSLVHRIRLGVAGAMRQNSGILP